MNNTILIYCYDAYCGWCFGFSKVMMEINKTYNQQMQMDVLSGGMVLPEKPTHISVSANYILQAYQQVENVTGATFGEDYLWHLNHTDLSDWYPNSEKPAIALCIFKEYYPERQVEFAADLQKALYEDGRDLTDDEAYKHLLEKYSIAEEAFYTKLKSEEYKEKAHYDFELCKQLKATGYPYVVLQTNDNKFHLVAKGYTDFNTLKGRIDKVLEEL